eukprot:c1082_g1_i1.p1 GENE.c1082_g1_i1~~c1082_g1_i1.p1  ORF type:complete len:250 (+),score=112.87 c1082_g1_i1:53-802(+)
MSRQKLMESDFGNYGGIQEQESSWGSSTVTPQSQGEKTLSENVERFNSILNQLEQTGAQSNSPKVKEAKSLIPIIRNQLKNPPKSLNRQMVSKLERDFVADTNRFQDIMKNAIQKGNSNSQRKYSEDQQDQSYESNNYQQQRLSSQHLHVVTEEELAQEKKKELLGLESDLREISDLMKEVSVLVNESQTGIDSIEGNIQGAAIQVEAGNKDLQKGLTYAKSSRKKMCCVIVLILIIVLIIGLAVGLKK